MKRLIIPILMIVSNLVYGHDIRMAIFEISESQDGYTLDISFDRNDLEKSLVTAYAELQNVSKPSEMHGHIRSYIESNFQLVIDGDCVTPIIDSIIHEEEYVRIHAVLPFPRIITRIEVFNTCLIDYNEGHLNIIKSRLHNRVRTFRLSEERKQTTIEYGS